MVPTHSGLKSQSAVLHSELQYRAKLITHSLKIPRRDSEPSAASGNLCIEELGGFDTPLRFVHEFNWLNLFWSFPKVECVFIGVRPLFDIFDRSNMRNS